MPPHASAEIGAPLGQRRGYARRDDGSIFRGKAARACALAAKIEKPKGAAVPTIV
jgi:hypothetical protein